MSSAPRPVSRGIIWFGLLFTLVVPALGLGRYAQKIPGVPPLAGVEAFWWTLATLTLLYVLAVERRSLSTIGFRRPDWKTLAFGLGGGAAIMAFAGAAILVVLPLLHLHQDPAALKRMLDLPYSYRVAIVLRAGFCEEVLMRGYGIERLQELTKNRYIAGAVTLAIFSYAHLTNWGAAQIIVAGAAGLVLTILYLWRRDLVANMIAHWVTDGISLLLR